MNFSYLLFSLEMSSELINIVQRKEADGKTCAGVCKSCKDKTSFMKDSLYCDFAYTLTVFTPTSLTAGEACFCLL